MDTTTSTLLDELHRAGAEHDATFDDRLLRLRNLEPESGALINLLIRAVRARDVLELGTSNGYSTIWLAEAAEHVVSVEIDPARSAMARANLKSAGLLDRVDLIVEDAAATLTGAADDSFDVVFMDSERPAYVAYWPDVCRVLRPGGLVAVDNSISHADQVADLRALVEADERCTVALDRTGAGLLLITRAA
jgi:predicted O-methyltransferase YrrM